MDKTPLKIQPLTDGTFLGLIAFILSAIGSPFVVITVTGGIVVVLLHLPLMQALRYGGLCVFTTAIIPFIFVYAGWRLGHITDIHVALREQRTVPFVATVLSACVGIVGLRLLSAPAPLIALGVAFLANGVVLALITLRWKISIHAAVLTGCILSVALVGYPPVLLGYAVVPAILWARYYRGRHSVAQGIAGMALTSLLTPPAYLLAMAALR